MSFWESWRTAARRLSRDVLTLYLASRDPRVPVYARLLAGAVVAYAFSPIDLIPDFIPVVGHLDDLVVLPLGVLAVRRLIPKCVMAECRARADGALHDGSIRWFGAAMVLGLWLTLAVAGLVVIRHWLRPRA